MEALHSDDSCLANGDGCSLELLQRKGSLAVATMESQEEVKANSTVSWQGERETGSTCLLYHCDLSLGPTECHHFRCICANDYRWSPLTKTCEPLNAAAMDTGGTCYLWGCSSWRGPTKCIQHKCFCQDGYLAKRGRCYQSDQTTTTTTTKSGPPPQPPPPMRTTCSLPNTRCGSGFGSTDFSCCETGYVCQATSSTESICSAVTATTEIPAYGLAMSLRAPSKAPLNTFYMYRAQGVTSYPPENVNMASLAGVMWYLHNEIVGRADWGYRRKFDITRILRYKVQTRAPQTLFEAGMNFGVRFAFDSGQCTGPFSCDEAWQNYGYFVGCNRFGNFTSFPFPNFPVAYQGVWYSLPGKCPQMKYMDKSKAGSKGEDCLENQPGGFCQGEPTGAADCTYNFEAAGEISLDELEGITDYNAFIAAGNKEYDRITDHGTGMTFWNSINDQKLAAWRVDQATKLFEKHYPGSSLPDNNWEKCDFNYNAFYQTAKAKPGVGTASSATVQAVDPCQAAVAWAKSDGIYAHPDWYPGLTPASSNDDFQRALAKSPGSKCKPPR